MSGGVWRACVCVVFKCPTRRYLTPQPDEDPLAALLSLQSGEVTVNGEVSNPSSPCNCVLTRGQPCTPSSAFLLKRRVLIERARSAPAIAVVMGEAGE